MSVLKFLLMVVLGTTYFFSTCFCRVDVTRTEFNGFNLLCDDAWKNRTDALCKGIGQTGGICMKVQMSLRNGDDFSFQKATVPVCNDSNIQAQKCITGYKGPNDALVWKYKKIGRRATCDAEEIETDLLKRILENEKKTDEGGPSNVDEGGSSTADE